MKCQSVECPNRAYFSLEVVFANAKISSFVDKYGFHCQNPVKRVYLELCQDCLAFLVDSGGGWTSAGPLNPIIRCTVDECKVPAVQFVIGKGWGTFKGGKYPVCDEHLKRAVGFHGESILGDKIPSIQEAK